MRKQSSTRLAFTRPVKVLLFTAPFVLLLSACPRPLPEVKPSHYVAPSSGEKWTPPGNFVPETPLAAKEGGPAAAEKAETFALPELIDAALSQNPQTRLVWAQAQAAAANWGRSRSSYYPQIDAGGGAAVGHLSPLQSSNGKSYAQIGATLNYLLYDFGGRSGKAEAARQALIAANWNQNQVISDVLRNVPQAYYVVVASKAQVTASEQALREARESLAATKLRKDSGVATIADVLQAESGEAQARLNLASAKGSVDIARGNLATAIGWPANKRFDIAQDAKSLPLASIGRDVDSLVAEAKRHRADLNAAEATVHQKEAELKAAKAAPFPKLSGGGVVQREITHGPDFTSAYGTVSLQVPIFHGFDMLNQARAAKAQLDAAKAAFQIQEENVISDVWTSHTDVQTAREQVVASQALVASADESFKASLARYKAGVAQIVELLNAQSTLASARSQLIGARMNLATSYAALLHAVGTELSTAAPAPSEGNATAVDPDVAKEEQR
jgi:outer membrane protein